MSAFVLPSGPHVGKPITHVPQHYLRGLASADVQAGETGPALLKAYAQAELERRGAMEAPAVYVTAHAIDRASQKLLAAWLQGRTEGEGLHHWLHRLAVDALECGRMEDPAHPEYRIHGGIRFVFQEGRGRWEGVPALASVMPQREPLEKAEKPLDNLPG